MPPLEFIAGALRPKGRNVLCVDCANPACRHKAEFEDADLPKTERRFKCSKCGSRKVKTAWVWTLYK